MGDWDAIGHLYAQPGVSALCLSLQESCDVDVCVLLVLILADRRGQTCSPAAFAAFLADASVWRERTVKPLRSLRIALKPICTAADETTFRESLKRCELEAEAVHVRRLTAALMAAEPGPGVLAERYLITCGVDPALLHPLSAPALASGECPR